MYFIVDLIEVLGEFESEGHITDIFRCAIRLHYCAHITPRRVSLGCCCAGLGNKHVIASQHL